MHRRLLASEKWQWYLHDIGMPLFLELLIAVAGRVIMDADLKDTYVFSGLIVIFCLATSAATGSSAFVRQGLPWLFHRSA
jgi:hypothetical protein